MAKVVRISKDVSIAERLGVDLKTVRFTRSLPGGNEALQIALLEKKQAKAKTQKEYRAIGRMIHRVYKKMPG